MLVALLIGGVEALGLLGNQLALTGPFWDAVGDLNDGFGYLGFAVLDIFILCWAASIFIYRWRGYEHDNSAGRQSDKAVPNASDRGRGMRRLIP